MRPRRRRGHDFRIVLDAPQGNRSVGAIGDAFRLLQLIYQLGRRFLEVERFENLVALVEEHHERRAIRGEGESSAWPCLLRWEMSCDRLAVVISTSMGTSNRPTSPSTFCVWLDVELHLMRGVVVRVAHLKLRSAGAINPLMEEFVDVDRGGLLDRFLRDRR